MMRITIPYLPQVTVGEDILIVLLIWKVQKNFRPVEENLNAQKNIDLDIAP